MFTYSERDMHRMPAPQKTHLPIKQDIVKSGIMEDDAVGREGEVTILNFLSRRAIGNFILT